MLAGLYIEGRNTLVHQYKNNGYNIVLDVNSGMVHVVDDLVYDIIAIYNTIDQNKARNLSDINKEDIINEIIITN